MWNSEVSNGMPGVSTPGSEKAFHPEHVAEHWEEPQHRAPCHHLVGDNALLADEIDLRLRVTHLLIHLRDVHALEGDKIGDAKQDQYCEQNAPATGLHFVPGTSQPDPKHHQAEGKECPGPSLQ